MKVLISVFLALLALGQGDKSSDDDNSGGGGKSKKNPDDDDFPDDDLFPGPKPSCPAGQTCVTYNLYFSINPFDRKWRSCQGTPLKTTAVPIVSALSLHPTKELTLRC